MNKQADRMLKKREAILEAVAFSAEHFLAASDWEEKMDVVLPRLGQAAGVSRVYLFQKHTGEQGELLASQRYEWCALGIPAQLDNPDLQDFPLEAAGFGRWVEVLGQKRSIYGDVALFPASERAVLAAQGIQSLAIVPVFVANEWWGFIGFDQCDTQWEWSDAELDTLRTAAHILGAAIAHRQKEQALQQAAIQERALARISQALNESAFDYRTVLDLAARSAAELIGDTCVIALVSEDGGWLQPEVYYHPNPEITAILHQVFPTGPVSINAGVAGAVVRQGQPILVPLIDPEKMSAATRPEYRAYLDKVGVHSLLIVPLRAQGRVVGTLGLSRDRPGNPYTTADQDYLEKIAERVAEMIHKSHLAEALAISEAKFRGFLDSAPDAVVIINEQGEIIQTNLQVEKLFGYDQKELLGESIERLIPERFHSTHPGHRGDFFAFPRTREMGAGLALFARRKDGSEFPVEVSLSHYQIGDNTMILSSIRDITQRLQAEEATTRYLQKITDQTPGALYEFQIAPDGVMSFPFVSEGIAAIHPGLTAEKLMQDASLGFVSVHPEDVAILQGSIQISYATLGNWDVEFRIVTDSGIRWHRGNAKPERLEDGTVTWYGSFQDITERKQAEEDLRRQTARAEALVHTAARLNAELELDAVLNTICQETARALDVPGVAINLLDPPSQMLTVVADCGFPADYRERVQPVAAAAYIAGMGTGTAPIVIPDVQAIPDLPDALLLREVDVRTVIAISLVREGAVIGGLHVMTIGQTRHFREDELMLLQGLADQAAQAIANAQLYAEHLRYEKALRINEASLREAQKIAKIGSWTWDVVSNSVAWSDEMYTILGMDKDEQSGKLGDFFQFIHPDDQARVAQVTEQAANELRPIPIEYRIITPDGTLKHIRGQGTTVKNGAGVATHLFGTIQDITEQKEAEEDRLARKAAEQANAAKSEFLSRMSHELRTPMNSILGFAQLLEMSQKEPLTSSQHARVEQILKAGQHLLNLINEVLEISRIEAGKMDISLEAVDVERVAAEVLDLTGSLADERQIHLHQEAREGKKIYVTADLQRFKQTLINLVSNAIKYNKVGGDVWLSWAARPDGRCRIHVRDNGRGISLADQERLFQPFERLGAERNGAVGTGLGLAISKRLVELMGGQIGLESSVGEGSTFWVDLPIATHQLDKEREPWNDRPQPGMGKESYTLLCIEDNLANYELVQQILNEQMVNGESQVGLLWAIQGSIGLELARQHRPDLILLDLHLPDMPGREVLARLRQDETTSAIPVAVISADATQHQIERLKAGGADAYLTKPLNVPEFLGTVERLITKK
jgi:PAS domain S-box-containing protein